MTPRSRKSAGHSPEDEAEQALAWLKRHGTKRNREGMARYAIPSDHALGVSVANIRVLAKRLGRNHELAAALWDTGVYEARMLTSFVDEPARVTSAQMDGWSRDFDNWAICDTLCFHLFDRTPHAWQKVAQWCDRREEFVKRAAFALLWGLTVHDKRAADASFAASLLFIERAATDERNFVKKSVNMALRAIGKRNPALNAAAVTVARRLADSPQTAARWVGKDAIKELTSPAVIRRLAMRPISLALSITLVAPALLRAQAVSDSGTFVVRHAQDTVATERFTRTDTKLDGTLIIRNAKGTSQRWSAVVAPDATLPLIEVTVREGSERGGGAGRVVQRARVIFKEDSAAVDALGGEGLQTRLFATVRGAVPYLNLSFALLEQAVRRARATPPATQVAFFNLGGGQTLTARLSPLGTDSLTLDIGGVQYRLRVDPTGRVLGGRIPAQDVVADRR